MTYRIRNWNDHYENNRTRELKKMDWFACPVKLDGDGYTAIMAHPDGAAIFGAFIACGEVAARCDPRGTLVRGSGYPHDINSLARITRIPVATVKRMIDVCVNETHWIEIIEDIGTPQEGAGIPHQCAGTPQEGAVQDTTVQDTTQQDNTHAVRRAPAGQSKATYTQEFTDFWKAYPRHLGKGHARRAYLKAIKDGVTHERLMVAVGEFVKHVTIKHTEQKYIPHAATWLNGCRWEDDLDMTPDRPPERRFGLRTPTKAEMLDQIQNARLSP